MFDSTAINVGIIGYSIGRAHAHAWRTVSEYYYPDQSAPRLVSICGRTKEKVDYEAKKYGFEKTCENWKRLVRDPDVTVVDDCGPPSVHPEPMINAAELGKNVICEKPLAKRAADARMMLRAAEKAHVKHLAGFNYRFIPAVLLAKNLIQSGRLGRIYYFKGSYLNSNDGYDRPNFPMNWHFESRISGYGALSDLGSHAIDFARFLIGEVSSVCGASETYINSRPSKEGSKVKRKVDVDDLTIANLKFQNGALGILETSWITPGVTDFLAFEVYGSEGALKFSLERLTELQVHIKGESNEGGFRNVFALERDNPYMKPFWPMQAGGFSWEHTFVNELYHFSKCVIDDEKVDPLGATFYDGYRNCLIMDGIMKSAKSGKWEILPS